MFINFWCVSIFFYFVYTETNNSKLCQSNTDCPTGSFCLDKECKCLPNFVSIDGFCWKKMNIEEIGCSHHKQCTWFGSKCLFGKCVCPKGQKHFSSRHGIVCHKPKNCPLAGNLDALIDPITNKRATCHTLTNKSQLDSGNLYMGCDIFQDIYNCIDNLCCPTQIYTCNQPLDIGQTNKKNAGIRFHFDLLSGSCQSFVYQGSGGNSNQFRTKLACQKYCSSKDASRRKEFICQGDDSRPGLPLSHKVESIRWYWNVKANLCLPFTYYGQAGSIKSFISSDKCNEYCSSLLCPIGKPFKIDGVGNLKCRRDDNCPDTHFCRNQNCCPLAVNICSQKLLYGSKCLSEPIKRFYWNHEQKKALPFYFNGCHGNENNFESFDLAIKSCSNVQAIKRCRHGKALEFKLGITMQCKKEMSVKKYLNQQLTPNSKKTFKDILAEMARKDMVLENASNLCPNDYYCYFEKSQQIGFCCENKAYTCSLKFDEGKYCLPEPIIQYYYSYGNCLVGYYNGCGGNSNRFSSPQQCKSYCESNKSVKRHRKKETFESSVYKLYFQTISGINHK